jgi:hypothetical protein
MNHISHNLALLRRDELLRQAADYRRARAAAATSLNALRRPGRSGAPRATASRPDATNGAARIGAGSSRPSA